MKDEALKLVLEALEAGEYYICGLEAIVYDADDLGTHEDRAKMQKAITAIKQALAAPVQERNFCERCGKRLGDNIHTCTPPLKEKT